MQAHISYLQTLLAEWTNPALKTTLKQRIKTNSKNKQIQTTQQHLTQQYFRSWLDIPVSNPLQRLLRHPLLTKQDKNKIDEYVSEQQKAQIKYASMLVGGTMTIYLIFLRKNSFFQNFFNNRERLRIFNITRKFFGVYFIFLGWMMTLNSHYQKKIPQSLNQMGMFKKYRILFEQKYV